ncbi:MAG: sigma-70 family RNA polymerase sigma factor, partial [Rhizobiales bacterium]|nr:sigma-70 family RNA polymerase sigma factor [Hyphomicrobiales bacterium]
SRTTRRWITCAAPGPGRRAIDGEDGALILAHLSDGIDWDERFAAFEAVKLVRAALGELSPRYRDVLVLRFLEDKDYDEISDILELPPGTVATLIRRGAEKLRTALAAPARQWMRGES